MKSLFFWAFVIQNHNIFVHTLLTNTYCIFQISSTIIDNVHNTFSCPLNIHPNHIITWKMSTCSGTGRNTISSKSHLKLLCTTEPPCRDSLQNSISNEKKKNDNHDLVWAISTYLYHYYHTTDNTVSYKYLLTAHSYVHIIKDAYAQVINLDHEYFQRPFTMILLYSLLVWINLVLTHKSFISIFNWKFNTFYRNKNTSLFWTAVCRRMLFKFSTVRIFFQSWKIIINQ